MMTKKQKGLLWLFGAMFLIPEILWSPILNFAYSILESRNVPTILRDNFLISSNYRGLAILVIFIQCIGALLSLILILKTKNSLYFKLIFLIITVILFIVSFLIFIYLLATINMGY